MPTPISLLVLIAALRAFNVGIESESDPRMLVEPTVFPRVTESPNPLLVP